MKTMYFELSSGISGDMAVSALVDLGVDEGYLLGELKKLGLDELSVSFKRKTKNGISGISMDVSAGLPCPPRHLRDIYDIIDRSALNADVKAMSKDIFGIIAEAEAKVHDTGIDEVHFHEVGAIDSIADIVAVSICIDRLKPDRITASHVRTGKGHVRCAHGMLPVPAPATLEILKGIPIYSGEHDGELVTPTGAAVIKRLAESYGDFDGLRVTATGYGIGRKDYEHANFLRIFMAEDDRREKYYVIETNIDDMNPELYEQVLEDLFDNGALDAYMQPVIMKKQRPGIILGVICTGKAKNILEDIILQKTSTFGLRSYEVDRRTLDRAVRIKTAGPGEVRVKQGYLNGKLVKEKYEYDDLKRIAGISGKTIQEIIKALDTDD